MKWGLKGGISIDAGSCPPRYVLWCCGGICHQPDTFIQIVSAQWSKGPCRVIVIPRFSTVCGSVWTSFGDIGEKLTTANFIKSVWLVTNTTAASKNIPRRPRISINGYPPFQTSLYKISEEFFFRQTIFFFRNKKFFFKKQFLFSFSRKYCKAKKKKFRSDPKFF